MNRLCGYEVPCPAIGPEVGTRVSPEAGFNAHSGLLFQCRVAKGINACGAEVSRVPEPRVPSPESRQKGFTLIELLVVIVIIATLAGMATLSLGGSGSRNWNGEVQRLAHLLQLVADRALIDKSHYGVVIESDGYQVVRFDPALMQWRKMDEEGGASAANVRRFAAHQLPPNMRLEVLSQTELPGSANAESSNSSRGDSGKSGKEKPLQPQFAALSSGEVLPVELALYLLSDGDVSRGATISYTGLTGLQLDWQGDD